MVYVSITGLRLKSPRHFLRFWWHALRSMRQARRAPGNLMTDVRRIGNMHHTLSIWVDEAAMRRFLVRGAHLGALRAFRSIATGRTLGFTAEAAPDWSDAHARWSAEAKDV